MDLFGPLYRDGEFFLFVPWTIAPIEERLHNLLISSRRRRSASLRKGRSERTSEPDSNRSLQSIRPGAKFYCAKRLSIPLFPRIRFTGKVPQGVELGPRPTAGRKPSAPNENLLSSQLRNLCGKIGRIATGKSARCPALRVRSFTSSVL